jgi:hypothetical protein
MTYHQRILQNAGNVEYVKIFTTSRNVLLGAGLCYSVEHNNYSHIPLVVVFPSIYAGYHMFKNREKILRAAASSIPSLS